MTADRLWVRKAAWWIAAVDGVSDQVRMVSLAVTGYSTFSILLQGFGVGRQAIAGLGAAVAIVGVIYTYLYNAGGVRNQVSRDRQDLSNNWAGPNSKIQSEMIARSLVAAEKGTTLTPDEREAVGLEAHETFVQYRDGTDLSGAAEE